MVTRVLSTASCVFVYACERAVRVRIHRIEGRWGRTPTDTDGIKSVRRDWQPQIPTCTSGNGHRRRLPGRQDWAFTRHRCFGLISPIRRPTRKHTSEMGYVMRLGAGDLNLVTRESAFAQRFVLCVSSGTDFDACAKSAIRHARQINLFCNVEVQIFARTCDRGRVTSALQPLGALWNEQPPPSPPPSP